MHPSSPIRRLARPLLAVASAIALLGSAPARAVDVDAGDYVAAPPGTNLALLYLQYASSDSLRSQGRRVPGNNGLDTEIGIARLVHFMELGGLTVDPQILLPFGHLKGTDDLSSSLGTTTGIGDPILAATVWLQNDPVRQTYTGITPYLYVPVGSYNRQRALNLGENRWRYNLQAAHVRPLGGPWVLDLIGDVTWYGSNTDYGMTGTTLKQKPLYQAQAWLRYNLSATADLRASVSRTSGGETTVAGLRQNDAKVTTKFSLGAAMFIAPKTQVIALWGQDTEVRNGFKESTRFNIRLLQLL